MSISADKNVDERIPNGQTFPVIPENEVCFNTYYKFADVVDSGFLPNNDQCFWNEVSNLLVDAAKVIMINYCLNNFETIYIHISDQSSLHACFRFPHTLLGNPVSRSRFWNSATEEFFFDRHRASFEAILYIYQSNGVVKRPEAVPLDLFLKELKFFEMGDEIIESFWMSEGYEKPAEAIMPQNYFQRKVWELMEYPDSSVWARITAFISIFVITTSIVSFCLETLPDLRDLNETLSDSNELVEKSRTWSNPFFAIECCCIIWFTVGRHFQLLLRFLSCPCKVTFMTSFLNIIDFVAIAPFFFSLVWSDAAKQNSSMSFAVLRVLRLVRVFRIFKLSRHSVGLQILGKTFKASIQEFCLLIFFLAIALVLFSSGVYFAEQNEPDTKFTSIPASFWFVLVTMTTVGYGDLTPTSVFGKMVGAACSLIGVLTLALPVPIIVSY
uniref:BTB domain-containing protein n=1 Tax=Syphacia muris TaxID=451379 RepID=A0A0N5AHJ7_9BILA